jgi:hypothetical protein
MPVDFGFNYGVANEPQISSGDYGGPTFAPPPATNYTMPDAPNYTPPGGAGGGRLL